MQLTLTPSAQFKALSTNTAISTGECHNAVRRLRLAELLHVEERRPTQDALHEFIVHGVPYAFPATRGPAAPGVVTAHASPAFRGIVDSPDVIVWAYADGSARGDSLIPIYPAAPTLPDLNPALYELLTIVDALRVGTTRLRKVAAELLASRLADTNR
ncbi:MAG: MarR family transcriptional regulator [Gemmatimonadales bacterium]